MNSMYLKNTNMLENTAMNCHSRNYYVFLLPVLKKVCLQ
jgi:hypothetical protein